MSKNNNKRIAIIGGGPSGLMAAETLAKAGFSVTIYERNPNLARKFLMAGRGGLNITNSANITDFIKHYSHNAEKIKPTLDAFTPEDLKLWCKNLGEETFTGSSGKVFPKSFKASPLLREWKKRLEELNVEFKFKHKWLGWDNDDNLIFLSPENIQLKITEPNIVIIALGGASWPKLGSDGNWVEIMQKQNIQVAPLRPANCGFKVNWSDIIKNKFAGTPLKPVILSCADKSVKGELMLTEQGLEGGAIYALSYLIREHIELNGMAEIYIDLRPDISLEKLTEALSKDRKSLTMSNFLRRNAKLYPAAITVIMEVGKEQINSLTALELAQLIKKVPLKITEPFSLERAISTAGGIVFDELDDDFMLKKKPNNYVIGEMLDWEAPTGGYLLQACFSTAFYTANAIISKLSD